MKNKIRIIIADDHTIFAEGLKTLLNLQNDIEVVSIVTNGKKLLNDLQNNNYDLILLDVNMPELDGIDTAESIKKEYPDLPILVLTMYDRKDILKKMISKGVNGYILKNSDPEELIEAIKITSSGGNFFYKNIEEEIDKKNVPPKSKYDDTFNTNLSKREKEILKLIAQGKTSSQIANQLFLSVFTVDTHRKNIASKLEIHNTADLVKYAIQLGLDE